MIIETITKALPYTQVIISILLIISVLLQQTGAAVGAGGAFGGGDGSVTSTRRGLEKSLLKITIFLSTLFFITSIFSLKLTMGVIYSSLILLVVVWILIKKYIK